MKIVVIGGTGLIGTKLIKKLSADGHDAVPASPQSGVNAVTGEGLDEALMGADVVVDVTNSPSFAADDVMRFFTSSTRNLTAAEQKAGVKHHVALSIVGADRLPDGDYLRAKVAQEDLVRQSGVPYSIVRATQFFEFTKGIADSSIVDGKVHLSTAYYQPIASDDVATAVAHTAAGAPLNAIREIGGPERVRMSEFISAALTAAGDTREVVADAHAKYFGTELGDDSLVPGSGAELGATTYEAWAKENA